MNKSISQNLRDYKRSKSAERARWSDLLDSLSEAVLSGSLSLREASSLSGLHRRTITAAVNSRKASA